MAVFDVVVNNADRKGGHVLAMTDGHRYGVDHGLTFHVEHKLRTVLWGWARRAAHATRTAAAVDRLRRPRCDGDLGGSGSRELLSRRRGRGASTPVPAAAGARHAARRRAASGPAIPWPPF